MAVRNLVHTLRADGHTVLLSGLGITVAEALRTGLSQLSEVVYHPDLDRSLEDCENHLLADAGVLHGAQVQPVAENQLLQDLTHDEVRDLLALGQICDVAQGTTLFDRGALANGIWLLVSGHVSILWDARQDATRLATLGPGQFVGEMGLIDGKTRSASARADTAVRALLLDSHAIATLVQQHPVAALKITRNIARELSLRLRSFSP
jgi:hypothetical protein